MIKYTPAIHDQGVIKYTALVPGGGRTWWGALDYQGGYHAHPKIHIIRVVFQDQALYTRTSFRGTKTCKI